MYNIYVHLYFDFRSILSHLHYYFRIASSKQIPEVKLDAS